MTRGRAATPDPFDIGAVSRSGELVEALAARRLTDPGEDPAVRLLAALVADVDKGAPPLPAPVRVPRGKSRRRVVRTVVTLGMTTVVLASAGAAVAGGRAHGGHHGGGARARGAQISESTDGSIRVSPQPTGGGRAFALTDGARSGDRRRDGHHSNRPGGHAQRRHDREFDLSVPTLRENEEDHPREAPTPEVTPSQPDVLP